MVEIYMMNRMNSLNWTLLNLHFVVSFFASIFLLLCQIFKASFRSSSMVLSLVLL